MRVPLKFIDLNYKVTNRHLKDARHENLIHSSYGILLASEVTFGSYVCGFMHVMNDNRFGGNLVATLLCRHHFLLVASLPVVTALLLVVSIFSLPVVFSKIRHVILSFILDHPARSLVNALELLY
jgi:hypothetical protein